jgi:type I restriction enzyme S subunit
VRPGYKQTEIGVIPEDWEVRKFNELFNISAGGDVDWSLSSSYRDEIHPFPIYSNSLTESGLYGFCSYADHPADSITITARGTLGVATYRDHKYTAIGRVLVLDLKCKGAVAFFAEYINSQLEFAIESTGVPQLTAPQIGAYYIIVPPLPEQSAIATALSDVDALLAGLDKLIAKKRDLKQAAMQQLLTGQIRLPGFAGEWEETAYGTVVRHHSGNSTLIKGRLPSEALAGLYPGYSASGQDVWCDRYEYEGDALIVSAVGSRCGKTFAATGKWCAIANTHVIWPNAKKVDSRYINHFLNDENFWLKGGSGQPFVLFKKSLKKTFLMPSIEEQTAIAEVLSDMDAELSALEQRREKTRLLKQGMMQELLTGNTRLMASVTASPAATAQVIDFPSKSEKPGGKPIQQESNAGGKKANVHFIRSVLAAEVIDRLHDEPTFGHVKCEKVIYLADRLCKVDTGSHYHRDAAGPYDNRALRSIDSQLKKQQWFDAQKVDGRYRYLPMAKRGEHKQYFDRYFGKAQSVFDQIIDTFRSMRTEQCEIVATLFEAWHDLLERQQPVSDDAIVHEVLNNWHDSKRRIDEDRWRKALDWMRKKGFVPEGVKPAC